MTVIGKIAPYRNKRVKGNTQKWFDSEVLKKLNARNKLFKKHKKFRLKKDRGVAANSGVEEGGRFKSGPFLYCKYEHGINMSNVSSSC